MENSSQALDSQQVNVGTMKVDIEQPVDSSDSVDWVWNLEIVFAKNLGPKKIYFFCFLIQSRLN